MKKHTIVMIGLMLSLSLPVSVEYASAAREVSSKGQQKAVAKLKKHLDHIKNLEAKAEKRHQNLDKLKKEQAVVQEKIEALKKQIAALPAKPKKK